MIKLAHFKFDQPLDEGQMIHRALTEENATTSRNLGWEGYIAIKKLSNREFVTYWRKTPSADFATNPKAWQRQYQLMILNRF